MLLLAAAAVLTARGASVSIESHDMLRPMQTLLGYPAFMYLGRVSYVVIVNHYMGGGNGVVSLSWMLLCTLSAFNITAWILSARIVAAA